MSVASTSAQHSHPRDNSKGDWKDATPSRSQQAAFSAMADPNGVTWQVTWRHMASHGVQSEIRAVPVSCCRRFWRCEALGGRKPTNWNDSVGSPDAPSDASTADGPAHTKSILLSAPSCLHHPFKHAAVSIAFLVPQKSAQNHQEEMNGAYLALG